QDVAGATDRVDQGRVAELASQVADVHLDEVVVQGVSPESVEDRRLRQRPPGVASEELQELELAGGELDLPVASTDSSPTWVEDQVAELDGGINVRSGRGLAPQMRPDAGEELGEVEWLGDVVVGPCVQSADAVLH